MDVILKSGYKMVEILSISSASCTPFFPVECTICGHIFQTTHNIFTIGLRDRPPDIILRACPAHDIDLDLCMRNFKANLPDHLDVSVARDFILDRLCKYVYPIKDYSLNSFSEISES